MTVFAVIGIMLLILLLIGLVRVGGEAEYSADGLFLRLRVGIFFFSLFPFPKKKEKKQKKKKKEKNGNTGSAKEKSPEKKNKGGSLKRLQHYLPLVGEAARETKRKIRIDTIFLTLTIAASDAASAAMVYGYANMAIGILWPIIEESFDVCNRQIQTEVDFDESSPTVYLKAAFSTRIGQLVSLGWHLGWQFLKLYQEEKREKLQKEAM